MSKIGRKAIAFEGVQVEIKPNGIYYQGKYASGVHVLPEMLSAEITEEGHLLILPSVEKQPFSIRLKEQWGLHRALLASAIKGAQELFERLLEIKGLGYKAILRGTNLEFSLGYSHKIMYQLPEGVTVSIDKTGQKLLLSSANKELVGLVASEIRSFRKPEPYKGTGIMYAAHKGVPAEIIHRKAGKAK